MQGQNKNLSTSNSSIKKFLKHLFIFIAPILLGCISFEIGLRNIPNDYAYKKHFLDSNSQRIQVLFLGSSHVFYGIDPQYSRLTAFNAAYISQSLDYDLAILEKYKDEWRRLKCIVIPIDYFSLFGNLETSAEAWRVKNYNIYYGLRPTNNLIDNTEVFSNQLKTNITRINEYYFKHDNTVTCSKLGWGTSFNSKNKQDLVQSGIIAAKRHSATSFRYFNHNVEIVKSILEFAKKRNIDVILFTSPAYKTYVQNLNNIQFNTTINTIRKVSRLYQNVVYYNLINDQNFTAADFYDADHLNEIGAKKLSMEMDSLINKSGNGFQEHFVKNE